MVAVLPKSCILYLFGINYVYVSVSYPWNLSWFFFISVKNFLASVMQFYIAGTDTTSGQLYWFYMFAGLYPEVQEKIHQEIKQTLGRYWLVISPCATNWSLIIIVEVE